MPELDAFQWFAVACGAVAVLLLSMPWWPDTVDWIGRQAAGLKDWTVSLVTRSRKPHEPVVEDKAVDRA